MSSEPVGGIDVYVAAHDAQYNATMARAAATAGRTAAAIAGAFSGAAMGQNLAMFGAKADQVFTGLGQRFRLLGRDLRNFSGALATVSGFGAYLSGRAFIETAGDFEQKMEIIKTLSGATERQMAALEAQTVRLGSATARTAGDIATGALELQKMGRSLDDISLILPSVTNFSIASDTTVQQAANTAGSVLMQFQMGATETARVMDTLTRGANQSAADVGDFSIALSYAGQQAFNANVSLERTVALMEAASNAGIPGSRLGTGLQSVLNDIYMPNMRQVALFKRFGIQTRETTGELRDLYAILDDIFKKLPQNQWGRFEVDTQNYLMALRGQGTASIRNREDDLMANAGGETARTADARMRGLKGALDALGGAFDALMIKAGEAGFTGVLTALFKNVGQFVANLSSANNETLKFAAGFGAVVLAITPVMFLLGSLLAIITSPEGLIFAFVALAAAAAVWSTVEAQIRGVQSAMDDAADSTTKIAQLNQQLATAAGNAADELKRQRFELTQTLRLQAAEATRQAELAEKRDPQRNPGSLQWWLDPRVSLDFAHGMVGTSRHDEAVQARARADQLNAMYNDAVEANFARDFPREGGVPTVTPHAPPIIPGDLQAGMMSTAESIEHMTRNLEAQAKAAQQSVAALQRLAGIQAIIEQSRDGMGGQLSQSAAAGIYDRQTSAQDTIALAQTRASMSDTAAEQDLLTRAMLNGERAYERVRIALDLVRQNQGMTADEAVRLATAVEDGNHRFEQAQARMQEIGQAFRDIGTTIAGAFEQAIVSGAKLSDTLKQLLKDILLIALRVAVIKPLGNWLGNAIGGLFGGGGKSKGGKAVGGTVWPGGAVEVGEQGRELFVPKVGGTIISAAALARGGGAGGASIVYAPSYAFSGTSEEMAAVKRMVANDRAMFGQKVRAVMGDARQRGRF